MIYNDRSGLFLSVPYEVLFDFEKNNIKQQPTQNGKDTYTH